jgi:hypothetical protein
VSQIAKRGVTGLRAASTAKKKTLRLAKLSFGVDAAARSPKLSSGAHILNRLMNAVGIEGLWPVAACTRAARRRDDVEG